MKDIFSRYHRHKVLSHLGILSLSAVLAVGVNMTLLNGNNSEYLKASVLDIASPNGEISDIHFQVQENSIIVNNSFPLDTIGTLNFSLAYNPEYINFLDIREDNSGNRVEVLKNQEGFISYMIYMQEESNLAVNRPIISLPFERLSEQTIHLNPVNINIVTEDNTITPLTSEPLMF